LLLFIGSKEKKFKETPVSELKEVDFSHVRVHERVGHFISLSATTCHTLLKDSPDGRYNILVVCCMDM
jgi:hypothetical protein